MKPVFKQAVKSTHRPLLYGQAYCHGMTFDYDKYDLGKAASKNRVMIRSPDANAHLRIPIPMPARSQTCDILRNSGVTDSKLLSDDSADRIHSCPYDCECHVGRYPADIGPSPSRTPVFSNVVQSSNRSMLRASTLAPLRCKPYTNTYLYVTLIVVLHNRILFHRFFFNSRRVSTR